MVPNIRNYTIHGEIGSGGMAVVYEATDNRLQRTVAIKVLHPHLCREPLASDRFVREARAAAKIDHPNVVRLYDYCAEDDLHYIVMEYVPGITLDRVLKERGPLSIGNTIAIMTEIAEALAQAHQLGIIHRDVKPANILLHRQGRAMLSDFGLAHHLPDSRLTTPDAVAGTPSFMSPEQIGGSELSVATDIYSWGVCFHAAATGKLPYATESFPDLLGEIRRGAVCPAERLLDGLSAGYQDVLLRCLATDPLQRIPDAGKLLEALRQTGVKGRWSIAFTDAPESSGTPASGTAGSGTSVTMVLPKPNRSVRYVRAGIIALVAAAAFGGFLLFSGRLIGRDTTATTAMSGGVNETAPVADTERPPPENSDSLSSGDPGTPQVSVSVPAPLQAEETAAPIPVSGKSSPQPAEPVSDLVSSSTAETTNRSLPAVVATPDSGEVFVYCSPWANVRIGEHELGPTPFQEPVKLPVGRYRVALSNPFCEPLVDSVTVTTGTVVRKRYRLQVVQR